MKKINLGQTISILANIGVIAGIVFLAVELRQNNEWLESESRYNHSLARSSWHETLATDEQLMQIMDKAREGGSLSSSEAFQLANLYAYLFSQWEWEFQENQLGRFQLSINGYRASFDESPDSNLPLYPGIRSAWAELKMTFDPSFVQWMEERIVN